MTPRRNSNPSGNGPDRRLAIVFILPNVSINGLTKVALHEIRNLDAIVRVVSLVKERREFPVLTKGLEIIYPNGSEILGRLMYPRYLKARHVTKFDIIIANNLPSIVVAHRLYKRTHIPYIAYIHNDHTSIHGTRPNFDKRQIIQALDNAAGILVNSKVLASQIASIYGSRKASILYPGCYVFRNLSEEKDNFYLVVHMVSLSPNFDILYRLLLRNKTIRVVIAGAKKYLWQYVYLRFKLKFGSRVDFVFDPTDEELSNLYRRSKMLLHTGIETFGMSPLEAAAHSTPSIAVKGSGVLEVLEQDKEIFVFAGDNVEQLNQIIENTYYDTEVLSEMGRKAYQKALKYDWNAHVKLLTTVINECLSS
jgi:glycosyltransferase involved in cell wall biosynthesis